MYIAAKWFPKKRMISVFKSSYLNLFFFLSISQRYETIYEFNYMIILYKVFQVSSIYEFFKNTQLI